MGESDEKYKIGEVSRLLGIPQQTLRYYEEQGILRPKKNEATGYRYYDAWDLNNLFDAIHYRALDFSLTQIEEILNTDSRDDILDRYAVQEKLILRRIEEYRTKLSVLSRERQKMQLIQKDLLRVSVRTPPGLLFARHRLRDRFQSAGGSTDFAELNDGLRQWLDHAPEASPTFLIQYESMTLGEPESLQYWWGFSMPAARAVEKGLDSDASNEYLPSVRCLYTVFKAGGEGSFAGAFLDDVYGRAVESGFNIAGNPFGRLLLKTHEDGEPERYFETWVPIED